MSSETVSGLSPKQWAGMVYLLQGAGFFTGGLTTLASIIVNHIAMEKVESDPVALSHFRYQIRTFWYSFLWGMVSLILVLLIVGVLGFMIITIWYLYRVVNGAIKLSSNNTI